ncbi:POSSIBLE CARBOXYLASE [hydrothermal vent metagenome]|uniref:POSSIBLE CARBOXYLASE n=1 Tax=hydrothermal vent metagenome TaxID=652676 RepID=A0A3B0XZ08_9ZZZZ
MNNKTLHSIQDIKDHFKQDETIQYFISASNFNLMVLSDWVKHWFNINLIDCYDEQNRNVILPEYSNLPAFKDIESINQFLLGNKEIVAHIRNNQALNRNTNALFLFYDRELEKMVDSLDMNLIMPANKLVKHIDNKITTTEIGNSVDVPSVPNALVKIENYQQLKDTIKKHQLGNDVVIQTAYGDSGKTTFFVSNEEDYHEAAETIEAQDKVKVMQHIQCLQVAMEACATRQGTYIGPILTEIIGHPKLTPYKGGWCGNNVDPDIFDRSTQETMYEYSTRLGQTLYKNGYRGYFEIDYLIDVSDTDNIRVYLGEINPRVTGISAITNMSEFCNQHIPLFLFHLLEFSQTEFDLRPEEFNKISINYKHPAFSQLIFKYTEKDLKIITDIPKTGIYTLQNGKLHYSHYANNTRGMKNDEIFVLRILTQDEYVYKGADMLILFSNKQLQNAHNELTPVADELISSVYNAIQYRELTDEEIQLTQRYAKHASLKSSADS